MVDFSSFINKAKTNWNNSFSEQPLILVGTATCGRSAGAIETMQAFQTATQNAGIKCQIFEVGCVGVCYAEPIVCIYKLNAPGICYANVTPEIAEELVNKYLGNNYPLPQYALGTLGTQEIPGIPQLFNIPVFQLQVRRMSRRCGFIDPTNIEHYLATDGYAGLQKALAMSPAQVIAEVQAAGLRGRGGAGFPTWKKWQFCFEQQNPQKYLICNADEGDPGASMNRMLLESDTYAIIEGMAIAAYAIGANTGYIYCRAEYPLAIERLKIAMDAAKKAHLLCDNILGSGFNFNLKIKEGAGAFVCGEETALIASIEGKRGLPKARPPFPAVSGLWGKPTIINNVETLAAVSHIFQNSAQWFGECGTEQSKGTKIFSLVGKVKRPCMAEVALGTTLRQMIYDIGGGIQNDKKLKAVQTGGPSGGSVPASLIDTAIDYEALKQVGTIMGSGGMVVMDEDNCMVDIARFFLDFTQKESCGKCVPCRLGTMQLLEKLNKITAGEGTEADLQFCHELSESITKTALCGLGQTAPNPVLTTMRYFMDEYKAHVYDKVCTAMACRNLVHYFILSTKCIGCDLCAKACPVAAISGAKGKVHAIDQDKCIRCGACFEACPAKVRAVVKRAGTALPTSD